MSFRNFAAAICACVCLVASASSGQDRSKSGNETGNERVDNLLRQMTLDEKLAMVHGLGEGPATYQGEAGYLPGIPRLGIPPMRFADGPPGVLTRVPSIAPTSTMGLAATFSRQDARLNGSVIGREARSHGVAVSLQPFINIDRDFAYSRGYNTFGEDPFLTGELGAAEITGIQGEGIMAQAKHYVGYDTDGTDVFIDDQALHEVYVAPFAAAVKAGVSSIMCSYNKIDGQYACGNDRTLGKILKGELGFQGFVTSDWGAVHATEFIDAGLDVEMPGPLPVSWAGPSYFVNGPPPPSSPAKEANPEPPPLTDNGLPEEPVRPQEHAPADLPPTTDLKRLIASGQVSEDAITGAAARVLRQMDRFGYLDGKAALAVVPADTREESEIVEKTATDAAVLLKNDGNLLPLDRDSLSNLAFLGPGAAQIVAVGLSGEKAVGLPEREAGPLAALKKLAAGTNVNYQPGDDMEGVPVPAEYLTHEGKPGLERSAATGGPKTIDAAIHFTRAAGNALGADSTWRWTGVLTAPEAGGYRLHLQHLGCWATLKVDDRVIAKSRLNWIHGDVTQAGQDNIFPTVDGLDNLRAEVRLAKGPHRLQIETVPDTSGSPIQLRLNWVTPSRRVANYAAAIDAAKHARTAVVFAWSRTRPVFALPGDQDKFIEDIAAVNPNTIVVLNVSQPVAMPWLPKVKAVLQMWWTGDEGGWATAKILLGQANPAGRLPFTWPRRLEDMAANDPRFPERSTKGVDGKTTFSEGVLVGYRWFDQKKIEPLFPFGFGMSYTGFAYSRIQSAAAPDGGVDIRFTLKNTGNSAGDEVAQVYLAKPDRLPAGVQFADAILAGFERVSLEPQASKEVAIHISLRSFQYWSAAAQEWVTPVGRRSLLVGPSSRDHQLQTYFDMSSTKP